eukprot:scaffold1110_cov254-Pinguiococcus_pyrenoidosus.AAC.8
MRLISESIRFTCNWNRGALGAVMPRRTLPKVQGSPFSKVGGVEQSLVRIRQGARASAKESGSTRTRNKSVRAEQAGGTGCAV